MVIPSHIKILQDNSRDLQVERVDTYKYTVQSRSNPNNNHIVTVSFDDRIVNADCTCEWANYQGIACSHVLATLEHMASLKGRTLSFWNDEDSARRQKHRLFHLTADEAQSGIWITSRSA